MDNLEPLLAESAARHRHLCPRQILGVRMGLLAGRLLRMELPQAHKCKRLLTIVETDGCAADGISVATNCWLGRRTLRIEDFGKVAATFIDTQTGQSIRIAPAPNVRPAAAAYAPEAGNRWTMMMRGYRRMPDDVLFRIEHVVLHTPVATLISKPGIRIACDSCQEEVINGREEICAGRVLCRACAGQGYYQLQEEASPLLNEVTFVTRY